LFFPHQAVDLAGDPLVKGLGGQGPLLKDQVS